MSLPLLSLTLYTISYVPVLLISKFETCVTFTMLSKLSVAVAPNSMPVKSPYTSIINGLDPKIVIIGETVSTM